MTNIFRNVFSILSFLFLSTAWVLQGTWWVGLGLILLLAVFQTLIRRKYTAALDLALVVVILTGAFGLWRGLNFPLVFAAVLCALAAWDLNSFSQRLAFAAAEDGKQQIERQHFLRLGLILGLGLGLSAISFLIQFKLSFEWAVVLTLITFTGIGALVSWLRNKET
jgi:hypothetical protein